MGTITTVISWVTSHLAEIVQIIGAFAVIATLTKNKSDDKIVQMLLDVVNFLGGNLGKSKNNDA